MSYYFETPELNLTLAEAQKMKNRLMKVLNCDVMVMDAKTDQEV